MGRPNPENRKAALTCTLAIRGGKAVKPGPAANSQNVNTAALANAVTTGTVGAGNGESVTSHKVPLSTPADAAIAGVTDAEKAQVDSSPDDEIRQMITANPISTTVKRLNKKFPSLHMFKDMFQREKKAKLAEQLARRDAEWKAWELQNRVHELQDRMYKLVAGELSVTDLKDLMEKEMAEASRDS